MAARTEECVVVGVRLYMVRHGKAAAGWDQDHDPGLDDTGRAQAREMAEALAPHGPLPLVSSPLRRARETATPLEDLWSAAAAIEPRIAEIPSPTDDLAERRAWLNRVMTDSWTNQTADLRAWRDGVVAALCGMPRDAVMVSHFIAINAAVGAATGDDRVVGFRPGNCSVTVLEVADGALSLVERGRELDSEVL